MGFYIYSVLFVLFFILFFPVIALVCLAREKWRKTFWKRLGFQDLSACLKGGAKPVWVHALSVGEMAAAAPLVRALLEDGIPVALSASTKTGYEAAQKLFSQSVPCIFYFPYDFYPSVLSVVSRLNPAACVLVESDVWPNVVHVLHKRKVPVILANARLSERSLAGYQRFLFLMGPVFKRFLALGVQSARQRERFGALGVEQERIHVTGNMKYDTARSIAAPDQGLASRLGIRARAPVLVAGSTHPGEETVLEQVLASSCKQGKNLFVIVAPRDPGRAKTVARIFSEKGWRAGLYSEAGQGGAQTMDVCVVDKMGVLAGLYALGDVCFVGGTLVPEGGHNPLEPASWAKPVVFGPDMSDFPEISDILVEQKAAWRALDASELLKAVQTLLEDSAKAAAMGQAARGVVEANQGAVARTLALVKGALENEPH